MKNTRFPLLGIEVIAGLLSETLSATVIGDD